MSPREVWRGGHGQKSEEGAKRPRAVWNGKHVHNWVRNKDLQLVLRGMLEALVDEEIACDVWVDVICAHAPRVVPAVHMPIRWAAKV